MKTATMEAHGSSALAGSAMADGVPARYGDLVTIIVPCYNAGRFITTTIGAVLAQTYDNIELLVVDDRSTDDSARIVEQFAGRDSRVNLITMSRNSGAPAAPRNLGVRSARGTWVAFLDADDVWHPRKLECQIREMVAHDAVLCSTQMRDFAADTEIAFAPIDAYEVTSVDLQMQLVKYRTPTSSIVVHRSLMLQHPFNEDLQFKAREDTDLFIRLHEYMEHSIKLMYPFVWYRAQQAQISGNKLKMVSRHLNMLKKYRLKSGAGLGLRAYYFTFTHFFLSIYLRMIRRTL